MRKHIDYYYKCFDKQNENAIDKINNERFNEYGYNFDGNKRRVIDYDALVTKTDYQNNKATFYKMDKK